MTNEIPSELSRENLISSHVKISPLLRLHNKPHLSDQKTVEVKWFGISLVFNLYDKYKITWSLGDAKFLVS